MIGGNVNEFIDTATTGQELTFVYKEQKFFLQGNCENGVWTITLDRWEPPSDDYIWVATGDSMYDCTQAFLTAKVFGGKDFWQVEKDLVWIAG